jgi:hypothetical protein
LDKKSKWKTLKIFNLEIKIEEIYWHNKKFNKLKQIIMKPKYQAGSKK